MSKYNNTKVQVNGVTYDSKLEYEYACYLSEQQKQGLIKSFDMQVPFILLEGYELAGRKVRPIKLIADFVIYYKDGTVEVHDTKGFVKSLDVIKKKMFESKFKCELKFIAKSNIDGGFLEHSELAKARKERKRLKEINKSNKI